MNAMDSDDDDEESKSAEKAKPTPYSKKQPSLVIPEPVYK
jgi:hypothetical protein